MTMDEQAIVLLDLLESDFGQSGKDVRFLAIRDELDAAYRLGLTRAAEICEDIMVNGKGGAPTCYKAILTERDKEEAR